MKKKINKVNYIKIMIIILSSSKDTFLKSKEPWNGKRYLQHIADKGIFIQIIYDKKENSKKSDNQRVKQVKDLKEHFIKEEIKLLIDIH